MDRLAIVSPFLLIPVFAVRIAELAFDGWWVGIAAVEAWVKDVDVGAGLQVGGVGKIADCGRLGKDSRYRPRR